MGAIVDIVSICRDDIGILKDEFPESVLINLTNTEDPIQRYRLIIPTDDVDYERYYNFLVDNLLAMTSNSFRSRCESDGSFKKRMTSRVAAAIGCSYQATQGKKK